MDRTLVGGDKSIPFLGIERFAIIYEWQSKDFTLNQGTMDVWVTLSGLF
jgi:hypothetical protein